MTFDQKAIENLVSALESKAMEIGVFKSVNFHEPKSAPGTGLRLAMWADLIEPIGPASGLSATTGYVTCVARVYGNMIQKPEDDIDPRIMAAVSSLMAAYSEDFTLGSSVRDIDLLGMYGQKMMAKAGYVQIGSDMYRIMDLTIPVVINDLWDQIP